jgi:hypothetical protein
LADRVDVLVDPANPILGQVDSIAAAVSRQAGSMFEPELVEAFLELAWKEYFWLDLNIPLEFSTYFELFYYGEGSLISYALPCFSIRNSTRHRWRPNARTA